MIVLHEGRVWTNAYPVNSGVSSEPGSNYWNGWDVVTDGGAPIWCSDPPACDCNSTPYGHTEVFQVGDCTVQEGSVYRALIKNTCLDPTHPDNAAYWTLVSNSCGPAQTSGTGGCSDIYVWDSAISYKANDVVTHAGKRWKLKWGDGSSTPGASLWGAWEFIDHCDQVLCDCSVQNAWDSTTAYYEGDCVA